MSGQDVSAVLDAVFPFDQRLDEIAQLSGAAAGRADEHERPGAEFEIPGAQCAAQHAGEEATDKPFKALIGADMRTDAQRAPS